MSDVVGAILPVGLVSWRRRSARNFGLYHWQLRIVPFNLFCDAMLPENAMIDRHPDATGIRAEDICQTCMANLDKELAARMTRATLTSK
jgi:hypothetical protein